MNLNISGHHVDVTDSMRGYVQQKMERITRHFDQLIDADIVLSVEKIRHSAEATLHASGKTLHAEATENDMYAAIDSLADKVDKQARRFKDKITDHSKRNNQKITDVLEEA